MLKLIEVIKSPLATKKYRAVFNRDGKLFHRDFGASGMLDYTISKDKERRRLFRIRHKKDLDTNDPTRAGYLSYFILWGPTTSIAENVRLYKSRFSL